ncbi:dTMP kinase [bacterium AH-315-I18]|nr:dTMP kinase [Phycisphaeraceae bacterium]MBN4061067.1 dTMP kinase [bacterium AH-315-I18]
MTDPRKFQQSPQSPTSPDWASLLRGKFIVFDGSDGSGKSTQFRRFVNLAHKHGIQTCEVREPGGTPIGEQIRNLLLDPVNNDMVTKCEMLLYMASRAQLIAQKIAPAMAQGQLVIADRFISSTLAYQGTAGGIPQEDILGVGQFALGEYWPGLVVVFDVDEQTASHRLNPLLDRMEQKGQEYHRRVRQGYLDQATADPSRYLVIDACPGVDQVTEQLLKQIALKLA